MPIRKRITDPYSQETRDFDKHRKYGKPPPAPRKPTAEDRKPIYDAIMSVPVGKAFSNAEWRDRYILPFMAKQYDLWGVKLALYPTAKRDSLNRDVCTGVYVSMLDRDKRTGMLTGISLSGTDKTIWYGQIIRWIQEQRYGG